MAQTVANIVKVLKEVWTADNLEKQFYNKFPILDRLERSNKYTIGKEAEVPLHTGRAGATTVLSSAGGNLNPADAQKVDRGTFGLAYNNNAIKIEFGAINQAAGGDTSVIDAANLEIQGAMDDIRKDFTRQVVGNGDALIANCGTTTASQTVNLNPAGYGYEAIVRGWLRVGQSVEVIAPGASDTFITPNTQTTQITAVAENSAAPSITISSAAITTSGTHYVIIAQARSGNAAVNETIGFRTMYGSSSTTIGGLNPATATYWQPAKVDTTTTSLSLDVLLGLQQAVFQKSGNWPTYWLLGIKQLTNLYSILQNQVRFQGDMTAAGNVQSVKWGTNTLEAIPDASDREIYCYDPSTLLLVTGKFPKPTWYSDLMGVSTGMVWTPGQTALNDALVYPVGVALRRRNTGAAAVGLTA